MKKERLKDNIEEIFRNSDSHNELFDAFETAVNNKINDEDLYKILIWNKALTADEVTMFSEKLCREFPEMRFKICFDTGKILEATSSGGDNLERALLYYGKSAEADPSSFLPYAAVAGMYNKDLNIPQLERVIAFLLQGMDLVSRKSKVCFDLAFLYKNNGNQKKEKEFQRLGEKYQREGN